MDQWNAAVAHIEDHLEGTIDMRELARLTLTSEYHFRRMFSVLAGMPVSDYIRRRRLTLAAAAVVGRQEAVQDIAVRYGYSSADAFSRAFRAVHGVGPQEARRAGAALRAQPMLRFALSIEGADQMEYRLEHKNAFTLVGRRRRMPMIYHGPNPEMTAFQEEVGEQTLKYIHRLSGIEPSGVVSVCTEFEEGREDGSMFDFWLAAATEEQLDPQILSEHGLETSEVPAHTWLVLTSADSEVESVQQLWPDAYGKWFPANPYSPVKGPELVSTIYSEDWRPLHSELWLPIAKD